MDNRVAVIIITVSWADQAIATASTAEHVIVAIGLTVATSCAVLRWVGFDLIQLILDLSAVIKKTVRRDVVHDIHVAEGKLDDKNS